MLSLKEKQNFRPNNLSDTALESQEAQKTVTNGGPEIRKQGYLGFSSRLAAGAFKNGITIKLKSRRVKKLRKCS